MSALRYGWRDDQNETDSFYVEFERCAREPKSWKEECYAAARAIANRTTKPLWLCFSGGLDSEILCRSFFDQGIHFSVLTIQHTGGTNEHDIAYARKWCKSHDVQQTIVPIDMEKFLALDVPAYAERFIANHPYHYFQIRLLEVVENFGGYAVLGGGELLFRLDDQGDTLTRQNIYLDFPVGCSTALDWCKANRTQHEPFFYFAPEVMLSYLRLPMTEFIFSNPSILRHSTSAHVIKKLSYYSVFPDLEGRYKYTGFEKIRPQTLAARTLLEAKFGLRLQNCRTPLDTLLSQLTPALSA